MNFLEILYIKKMEIIEINGYLGGVLNSIIFIPQLYKIYKTKSSNDISWSFIFLSIMGSIFSTLYFIEIDAKPMIYTNIFSLITRIFLGIFKFSFYYPLQKKKSILEEQLLDSEYS